MKDNKFVIISTVYNKAKWVSFNINSVKQQTYTNYLAVYGYDKSTDETLKKLIYHIEDDEKFIIHHNDNQDSQMSNFFSCYNYLKTNNLISPEDIIVEVDADDWLLHSFVMQYLNEIYQDPNIWMSYGQYVQYPSGETGGHFYLHLTEDGTIRHTPFAYSHLKTYKAWLLDKVPQEYLINPKTKKYWNITADFAMCMPMVEMAGRDRIYRVDAPIYVYNNSDGADNESARRLKEQKEVEQILRQLKPLQKL